jgi:DNA-binding NarL/FixJ family response regulator
VDAALQPIVLTERQRRLLWLLSVGRPREVIARETGVTSVGVKSSCNRIYRQLGASTAAQAVRNGLLAGHIGPYEDCGTLAAYRRHIKRDEAICAACKRGNRERAETEAALRNRRVTLSEAETRLLRAFDAGRTVAQICTRWGVSQKVVKELTASAYAALGVSHLPQTVRREAALREAAARGLLRLRMPEPRVVRTNPVTLTDTQVRVLVALEDGASLSEAARELKMHPGTLSTRLSEAYRRLDVAWMDKADRRPAALRKAREHGLLPEPATT